MILLNENMICKFGEQAYRLRNKRLESKTVINASPEEWEQIAKEINSIKGLSKTEKLSLFLNLSNKTNSMNTKEKLNLVRGILKEAKTLDLPSKNKLEEVAERNGLSHDSKKICDFWVEITTPSQRRIEIKPSAIRNLLSDLGFYKNPKGGFLKLEEKFICLSTISDMIEAVENHIDNLPENYFTNFSRSEIKDALVDKSNLFNSKNLLHLKTFKKKLHRCSESKIYFYGKDAFIEITTKGITVKSYSRLNGYVWRNKVMDIEFNSFDFENTQKSDFEEFMFDVSDRDRNKFNFLKKMTGYILHTYNDPSFAKAVILFDKGSKDDETASGGRGKNVYVNGLKFMRFVNDTIDGRNYELNSNPFKEINETDDIVLINDADKNFPFQRMFNAITEGFTFRKLYNDSVKISFEENPKLIINSNYWIINLASHSEKRRVLVFSFGDYYQKHSITKKYGKRFFTDWDKNDWNSFRMFMFKCAYEYLKYPHILKEEKDYLEIEDLSIDEFIKAMDKLKLKEGVFYKRSIIRQRLIKLGVQDPKANYSKFLIAYFKARGLRLQKGGEAMKNRRYFYKKRGHEGFKILPNN